MLASSAKSVCINAATRPVGVLVWAIAICAAPVLHQVQGLRAETNATLRPRHHHHKYDLTDGHNRHRHRHVSPVNLVADERYARDDNDALVADEQYARPKRNEREEDDDGSQDRRADLCEQVSEYQRKAAIGSSHHGLLVNALRGMEISAAVFDYPDSDPHMYKYDEGEDKWSGWMLDIMDAVAKKGGFTYKVYSVPMNESTTWTHDINKALMKHDVLLTWGLSTFERTNMGIHMPYGLLDASSHLVTRFKEKKESMLETVFQFLRPFKTVVWLTFIAICGLTGVVYYVLERGQNEDDLPEGEELGSATFLAYFQVTGGGGYAPKTWPGKIMVISWAWMIVLFTTAYTANLASFLVVKNKGSTTVDNMREAMAENMDICAMGRSAIWTKLTEQYPDYNHFVPVDTSALGGLAAGKCEAALSLSFNTDFAQGDKDLNPKCDLKTVGGTQDAMLAGWSVKDDFVDKCTVLVTQVLEVILQDLAQEGALRGYYRDLLDKKKNREACPVATGGDDGRLGLMSMAGIFGVHLILSTIALACWVCLPKKDAILEDP